MIPILITVLACAPIPVERLVSQYGPYSHFVVDTVSQGWWDHVLVLDVYPVSTLLYPSVDDLPSLRLSLDTSCMPFRLWPAKSNDFEKLVDDHPLDLSSSSVRSFGQFFINCTQYFDADTVHFLDDTKRFLKLNRELKEGRSGRPVVQWDSVVSAIDLVLKDRDLKKSEFDATSGSWMVDYYIWRECNGNLEFLRLKIGKRGRCEILRHETLASHLGYWKSMVY